jgi:Carboxypeptidase regulatory-like domain
MLCKRRISNNNVERSNWPNVRPNANDTRRQRRPWLTTMLWLLLGTAPLSAATILGGVTGTVVDDKGKPVSNATVTVSYALPTGAQQPPAPPVITGARAAIVKSDGSGYFKIDNLRAGHYVACAQTAVPGLLDPCHWSAAAPDFTITAGQEVTGLKIVMNTGATIQIHLDDPQKLLAPASGPVDFDCQFHIVTPKGHHYQATIQAASSGSRDQAVTIPYGMALTLITVSPHVVLKDQSGNAPPPLAGCGKMAFLARSVACRE